MPARKPPRLKSSSAAGSNVGDQKPTEALREERGRLLVALRVTPRAARDEMALDGDVLRVRVTAPPAEGAANDAVIAQLARRLRLPKNSITLVRGAGSRDKLVAIEGLSAMEFRTRCGL